MYLPGPNVLFKKALQNHYIFMYTYSTYNIYMYVYTCTYSIHIYIYMYKDWLTCAETKQVIKPS